MNNSHTINIESNLEPDPDYSISLSDSPFTLLSQILDNLYSTIITDIELQNHESFLYWMTAQTAKITAYSHLLEIQRRLAIMPLWQTDYLQDILNNCLAFLRTHLDSFNTSNIQRP